MFNEEYNIEQNNRYNDLQIELGLFLANYLLERNDDRVLKNPSNKYTRLKQEVERLTSLPSTQENITIIGLKQKELDNLRAVELNEKQPLGPFKEKIDNLKNIYDQIVKDYNGENDKMKQFLMSENILNQSGNPSFESLIEKYIAKHLLNNVNQSLNPSKTLESMNNLLALIISFEPDGDGIISNSQKSSNKIFDEFLIVYKSYSFKIQIKEEPSLDFDVPEEIDYEEPLHHLQMFLIHRNYERSYNISEEGFLKNS